MRRAGIVLGHGGEFGLMLISVCMSSRLISDMVAGPILLAIGFSMPIGSILVRRAARSDAGVD
jgi:CPA2 family monovalent cation:H+ antiporter-2